MKVCVCVIMFQVNKCLCLSLKYICSQRLSSVYQLLTVGATVDKQITHEFINLGPCMSGYPKLILWRCLCRHVYSVCLCINMWYIKHLQEKGDWIISALLFSSKSHRKMWGNGESKSKTSKEAQIKLSGVCVGRKGIVHGDHSFPLPFFPFQPFPTCNSLI